MPQEQNDEWCAVTANEICRALWPELWGKENDQHTSMQLWATRTTIFEILQKQLPTAPTAGPQ